jgi:hypothetical protein
MTNDQISMTKRVCMFGHWCLVIEAFLRHPHPGPLPRLEDSPQGEGGMKALEKEMMRALS